MDEAESAQSPNEAYYQSSPFGFLADSYFTQPQFNYQQYGNQQIGSSGQPGLGIEYSHGVDYSAPTSPFSVPAIYQPCHSRDPMDPNLLSAENYQERAYEQTNTGRGEMGSTQLYMGFLASKPRTPSPPSPPASNMKSRRTSKKDAAKGVAAENNSTRQRGRPRLDNHDQTAAERRRTQIRLAQRAYRQRKETTILGLNKRVSSLEKTIEDMHKTFLAFKDTAIASGIQDGRPALAKHLESTAERLADLAKNSDHETDAEDDELDPVLSAEVAEGHERTQFNTRRTVIGTRSDHVPMLGYQTTFDEEADDDDGEIARQALASQAPLEILPLSDWTATEAMQQFPIEVPAIDEISNDTVGQLQQYAAPSSNAIPYFDANDVLQYGDPVRQDTVIYDVFPFGGPQLVRKRPPDTPAPTGKTLHDFVTLPLPTSYSFQEASFARRLLRTALEASYRLMTDPNSRPEDVKRMCKFTWCFTNSPRIVDHLKGLMERTANQNLERWEVPAIHLGGAGMHYPRVGIDAGGAPPEWWANEAPTGPLRPLQPETPVPDAMMIGQIVEQVGFDGEWFDSNDVEQYLQSKGLYLDAQSSLVELNDTSESLPGFNDTQDTLTSSPAASSQNSTGGPRSPQNPETNWSDDPFLQGTDFHWNEEINMAEIQDFDTDFSFDETGFSDAKAFPPNLPEFNIFPDIMPTFNTRVKRFVDVDKFLNTIAQSSVCLGRTPGFRRAAVDSALVLATTEVF